MLDKEIKGELRRILRKAGRDPEIINQKISSKHNNDEIKLLLEHISLIVEYLMFDAQASRNELFDLKRLNEYGDTNDGDSRILGI